MFRGVAGRLLKGVVMSRIHPGAEPTERAIQVRWLLPLAVLLAAGIVATMGYAAIPRSDGVIQGCYAKVGGVLRVIDSSTQACTKLESSLTWNQTGPLGPAGPGGPAGPQGPPGPAGTSATGLWVVANGDGTVQARSDPNIVVIKFSSPAVGQYQVRFPQDVNGCAAVATIGRNASDFNADSGFISAAPFYGTNTTDVEVLTRDLDAFLADKPFTLAVFC